MKKVDTQNQLILDYLKKHPAGITSMEAFQLFGITRLSARIFNLRDQGNIIASNIIEVNTRYGKKRIAEYRLISEGLKRNEEVKEITP